MGLRKQNREKTGIGTHLRPLTKKELRLIEEFKIDGDFVAAQKRAGYQTDVDLPENFVLKKALTDVLQKNSQDLDITHQDLLRKLKKWYDSDITQTIGLTGEELAKLDPDIRKLITKYRYKKRRFKQGGEWVLEETIDCEFVSKEKAMEMVAKHIGFFTRDNIEAQLQFDMANLSDNAIKELSKMLAVGK